MKIILPTNDKETLASHFARADYFAIYDTDSYNISFIENKNNKITQGAGIKVATELLKIDFDVLISRIIGPKALDIFKDSKVKIVLMEKDGITIGTAIKDFLK